LTQHLGWRSIFLVNVLVGIITFSVAFWRLRGEWAEAAGEKFDFAGTVVYSLMLVAIMYGFSLLPSIRAVWLISLGCLGFALFIRIETKSENPLMEISLFTENRMFAFSNLTALINYSSTFAVGFLLSLYLQYLKGLHPQDAGLILAIRSIVQATFSPFAGRLSDRIEPRKVASIGMAITTLGLLSLTFLERGTSVGYVAVGLVLLGFGFSLFSAPNTNAVMSSVGEKYYGVASATFGTMRLLRQMFSMGIATLILTVYLGRVQMSPEFYPLFLKSLKSVFTVFTTLCLGGILASITRGKIR